MTHTRGNCISLWHDCLLISNSRCQYCGCKYSLECHHIIRKDNHAFCADLRNGLVLCSEHHRGSDFSPHITPVLFSQWLERQRPEQFIWTEQNRHILHSKIDFSLMYERLEQQFTNGIDWKGPALCQM